VGFGFCGWDTAEAVHEALLVEPVDEVDGDQFDVGQGAQRAATKRRVCADAFVLVEPDGGLGQDVVPGRRMRSIPLVISELSG
jgi:hypothetical protein